MDLHEMSKEDFLHQLYNNKESLMQLLNKPDAIVVKSFYPKQKVLSLRNSCFKRGMETDAEWHPLKEGCPDYHRLHDNYPQAYVKQKFHAFYHHGYQTKNAELFDDYKEIFEIKNFLADKEYSIHNSPKDRIVARINVHHYPRGGGYQMEHIDPANDFARIQTLICASEKGKDFFEGGVYGREHEKGKKYFLDDYLKPGDLLIISPDIHHGVHPIDEEEEYSWRTNDGRWMILPLFVVSDYNWKENIKPIQVD
jgi:hypothetical protein